MNEPTPPREMAARAARDLGTPHARAARLLSGNDCVAARRATDQAALAGVLRRLDDYRAAHDAYVLIIRELAERLGTTTDLKTFAELAAEGGRPKPKGRGKPPTPAEDDLSDDELDRLTAPAPAPETQEPKPDGDRTDEGPAGEGERGGEGPLGKFFSRRGDG